MKTEQLIFRGTLLIFFIFTLSCKKDKLVDPVSRTAKHFPMAVGNYWVYDVIGYDLSTYSGTYISTNDTVKIVGKKEIDGKSYFQFKEDQYWHSTASGPNYFYYRRDSAGYIIDEESNIHFTALDFDRILNTRTLSPNHYIEYSIRDSTFFEFTPAGTFECLDYFGTLWNVDHWDDRKLRNAYGTQVGLVYQNVYYTSNPISDIRRVLKAFYIQD